MRLIVTNTGSYPRIGSSPETQRHRQAFARRERGERFETAPFTKDLSLGVLDVHSHVVETPDQVTPRIQRGLDVLSAERIWVDPDCGLKTRTVDETRHKLEAMMTAVRHARATAGAAPRAPECAPALRA